MNLSIDNVFCTENCREIAEHLLDPCVFFKLMLNDKFHLLSLSHRSLVQLPLQHFIMSTVEVVLSKSPVDLVPQVLSCIFELFDKVVVLLPNRRRGSFNKLKVAPVNSQYPPTLTTPLTLTTHQGKDTMSAHATSFSLHLVA